MRVLPRSGFVFSAVLSTCLAQQPGPNVNVLSSDPFNQKQVEVDAAANPVNPSHILAGYIDYQIVANEDPAKLPNSSAWCGYSFSVTAGKKWKSGLVPGYPGDNSPAGLRSPIAGASQCGDPTITWDTAGHAFLMGLAVMPNGSTMLFVARFTDPDDGGGKLVYDFAVPIANGNPSFTGQLLDKPSILFVPDPSPGAAPDAGTVFACGTIFDGTIGGKFRNKVACALSSDGGVTYSKPNQGKVNGNVNTNNGTAIAPAPNGGVYVFWRAFLGAENGFWFVTIDKAGNASTPVLAVGGAGFYPYDAPTRPDLARTDAFPTVATDANGRVLLAFQAYSDPSGVMGAPGFVNTPRVFLTYSANGGASWTTPRAVDYGPQNGTAFQWMPRIAVGGGGLITIVYYDERNDGRPISLVPEGYLPAGSDRRADVRVVQGSFDKSGNLSFNLPSVQVSDYRRSSTTGAVLDRSRGCSPAGSCPAYLLPNLKIAGGGTVPFIGDYIAAAAAVPLVRTNAGSKGTAWRFANQPDDPANFIVAFTSTQDVGFPLNPAGIPDISGDWTKYSPAGLPSCINPKTRDANVYFTAISPGVAANWQGTSRPLVGPAGNPIPPEFIVTVENPTGAGRYFRLTIVDNAPSEDWSFVQTPAAPAAIPGDQNTIDTQILGHSSVTFPVFYRFRSSSNAAPAAPIQVKVQEISGIGGNVVNGGLKTSVTYSTSPTSLQVNNLQVSNLQVNNQPQSLQVNNLQVNNLQVNNASPSNLQVSNLQVSNLQVNNSLIPDKDVTWTVTGTGSLTTAANAITNAVSGSDLLSAGYQFQLLIYQTQMNPDADACSNVQTPTDVIISNIAITDSSVNNLQVNNLQVSNLQVNNSMVNDPLASNATFTVNPGDEVKITLRSFKPAGQAGFSPNFENVGQAVFSQAANPDGTQPSAFFDFTPPVITSSLSGTRGLNGWFVSPVTATWSVLDPQSGVVGTSSCAATTLTADTAGTNLTCSAQNGAGLSNAFDVLVKIDQTPPVLSLLLTPNAPDGNNGWWKTPGGVGFAWTCQDNLSGIDSTFNGGCPSPLSGSVTAQGTTVFSRQVRDSAGNLSPAVSRTVKLDNVAPGIAITAPASGGSYILNARVPAQYACTDATSGIASCAGPVPNGSNFATGTVGANTFTVTAGDKAGNSSSLTSAYQVLYNFTLLPLKSPANLGSAVPVNWQLRDATGRYITDLKTLVSLKSVFNGALVGGSCALSLAGITQPLYSPATGATGGSNFRLLPGNTTFQFNWDTTTALATGAGCYTLVLQLTDNTGANGTVLDPSRLRLAGVQLTK